MNVGHFMTRDVATASPSASLRDVVGLMVSRGCGWVPIVDDTGHPLGVLTDRDVAVAAWRSNRRLGDLPALDAATRKIVSCSAHTSVREAEALMGSRHVRRLAVLDLHGRLLGMVSVDDLAQLAMRAGNHRIEGLGTEEVLNVVAEANEPRASHLPTLSQAASLR